MNNNEMTGAGIGCNTSVAENELIDMDNMFKCELGKEFFHMGFMEDNNKLICNVFQMKLDSSPQESFCNICNEYHNAIATAGSEYNDCAVFNSLYGINLLSWFCKFYTNKLNKADSDLRDKIFNSGLQFHIKTFKDNHRQFYNVFSIYVNKEVLRGIFYDAKFNLAFDKLEEFLSHIDRELN